MVLKDFPFFRQLDQMDCGPACLKMISKHYGKIFSLDFLRSRSNITKEGVSFGGIAEAAESIGFHSLAVCVNYETLEKEVQLPCIAHWRNRHFVVVYAVNNDTVSIADPAYGLVKYKKKEFISSWERDHSELESDGYLLILEPTPKFYETENNKNNFGFNFLFKYFKPFKKQIFQLFLGLFIGSILQLIFPFLTQAVVDYGINYENINFVYLILIAQLVLFFSQISVDLIRGWILLHVTSRININLISDFLLKLMKLPISFFDSKNTGDIIQRIYDHQRIQDFLSTTTLNTLFSVFNVLTFGAVLAYYSLEIFLIFISGTLLYLGWTLIFMKRRAELDYKRFDQSSENQNSIFQLVSGMQEIKLNGSERRRRWEWEEIQVKLFKISLQGLSIAQAQNIGGRFLNELKNIFITFLAARSVIKGELSLGMMLSIQYIIGQLNLPINNFIAFIQAGQDAKISLERLSEIHLKDNENVPKDLFNTELPSNHNITFSNVSFRYGGKSSPYVLNNLSFMIPEGKVTAIVGESGSGKTTLLKLILKFYQPNTGYITIGNTKLENINTQEWRKKCGTVMQDGFLFGDSIARNITESNSEDRTDKKKLQQSVILANIEDFIDQLPSGYNTKIGSAGSNLSGGQKQRILIARAVYKSPSFILFDEATSALDANNEKIIMKNLQSFYKGRTVIIVAHRLSTVRNADQIIVMKSGNVIEQGTHNKLTTERGTYYNLVRNQLELSN